MEVLLLYNNSISKACKPRQSPYSSSCNAPVKVNLRSTVNFFADVMTGTAGLLETRKIFLHSNSTSLYFPKSENTMLSTVRCKKTLHFPEGK